MTDARVWRNPETPNGIPVKWKVQSWPASDVAQNFTGPTLDNVNTKAYSMQLEAYQQQIDTLRPEFETQMQSIQRFYSDPERGAMRTEQFPLETIIAHAQLDETARIATATVLLWHELTPQQSQALLDAHQYCDAHGGIFGMNDGEKVVWWRKMTVAGYSDDEIWKLGDSGLGGGVERFLSNRWGIITTLAFYLAHMFLIQWGTTEEQLASYSIYWFARSMHGESKVDEMTSSDTSVTKKLLRTQTLGSIIWASVWWLALLSKWWFVQWISGIEYIAEIVALQLAGMTIHEIYAVIKSIGWWLDSTEWKAMWNR